MQIRADKLFFLISLTLTALLLNGNVLLGQQLTETPEPTTPQSLFASDTCAPPCWFGLVPGESTEEEVLAFLDAYDGDIGFLRISANDDIETGEQIGNRYYASWRDYSYFNPPKLRLTTDHGVLNHIWANPNREITFGEMLDILGLPDHLYLGNNGWASLLTAIYVESRLRILLDSRSIPSSCQIQGVENEFRVMEMRYFSLEVAQELVTPTFSPNDVDPQPRLLLHGRNMYTVSEEQLEQWLSSQEDATCSEAWIQLRAENP